MAEAIPQVVAEMWHRASKKITHPSMPPAQRAALQATFYAGAMQMFQTLFLAMAQKNETNLVDLTHKIDRELNAYAYECGMRSYLKRQGSGQERQT